MSAKSDDDIDISTEHQQLVSDIHKLSNFKLRGNRARNEVGYDTMRDATNATSRSHQIFAHELARLNIVDKNKSVKKAIRQSAKKVKPRRKFEEAKIIKHAAARKAGEELSFWAPFVHAQRVAESLHFSDGVEDKLSFYNEQLNDALTISSQAPKGSLSDEIAKLIASKKQTVEPAAEEEKAPSQPRLIELEDSRKIAVTNAEIRRMRVIVAREAQKNRRIKRAKGRHFRRLHRKQKEKREARTLTEETAAKKFSDDTKRIKERMTLKHKSVDRKITRLLKYAKHNPAVRQILMDRLEISNRLKRKTAQDDDEDSDEDNEEEAKKEAMKKWREIKALERRNSRAVTTRNNQLGQNLDDLKFEQPSWLKDSKKTSSDNKDGGKDKSVEQVAILNAIGESQQDVEMVGQYFDENEKEFQEKKKEAEKASEGKTVNLSLPGWNCWAGGKLGDKKTTKQSFIKKIAPVERSDKDLPNVIINTNAINSSLQKHQVNRVPFPFKTIVDYEESLKQPLGREWNPETVFRKFNKPRVVTAPGMIIPPVQHNNDTTFE